ncbi:MAG: lysophospholipid acyltransferase family protein, partial [Polyangiaceae bacterium]
ALTAIARQLNSRYLSLQRDGLEHIEAVKQQPALFVSNHNGGISGPDLSCTLGTLWETLGAETPLYALAHDFVMRQMTPVGRFIQRVGAVRACPENALRILESGGKALVYPGGDLEAYRHSRHKDRIVLGERTGFIRLVQKAGVPIVPIVVQGAHRSAIILDDGERIARKLRLHRWGRVQRFPIALALPWGIALGPWMPYLPLPFPIRLRALPPMHFSPDEDPVLARERVRSAMQSAMDDMTREAEN